MESTDVAKMLQNPKAVKMIETLMKQASENPDMLNDLLAGKKPSTIKTKKIPPNSKCPCGSEKKYKKCCINKND